MRPRYPLGPLAVLVLALALGSALARQEKEPTYEGKPLSEWLKWLRSAEAKERRAAAFALSTEIGPEGKAAVPALIEALKDEDKDVRSCAAQALGDIGPEARSAGPALVEALKDKDPAVSFNAVQALSSIGPQAKAVVPALIEALKDPATRASAADVLGNIGPEAKAAVPALLDALKDKDANTRASAAFALGSIGPEAKAAVPALTEALKEENASLRRSAVFALGSIGPGAKPAFPALRELLKDKTSEMRQAVTWALHQIDPKAAKEASIPEPVAIYHAILSASAKGFERDDVFRFGSFSKGEAIHTLVFWMNGDPVFFFGTNEGRALWVNQWLRPGKNELTFSGKHEKPVYLKVARQQGGSSMELLGKRKFPDPGAEGKAEPLVFSVERPPKLPEREALSDRPRDRERYEKEIRALIAELKNLAQAQKGPEATRLLFGGPLLFDEAAYGMTAEESLGAFKDGFAKLKAVDEGRPLRLLFGKHAVLAYVEPPEKDEHSRHLLVGEHGKERLGLGPFQLARVGGKWIFWYTEIAPVR